MRLLLGITILLVTTILGVGLYIKEWPTHQYAQWIKGRKYNTFYWIDNFSDKLLVPPQSGEIPDYKEDYIQLWKPFPLVNSMVPLPTRHPMYQIVPIIKLASKEANPILGISFLGPDKRKITDLYTLPMELFDPQMRGQDLFKLPYAKNRIMKKKLEEIWHDLFTKKIVDEEKHIDEMIYDLYIIHLRSKFLPKNTMSYGIMEQTNHALIEVESADNDYRSEIVMMMGNGQIFSYLLVTELNRPESVKLRSKFLNEIKFRHTDNSIGPILYQEFKQLSFSRQIDQEGLTYLFSAWTQDPSNVNLVKEMINYLERSPYMGAQLRPLYSYSFRKYGKTFTAHKLDQLTLDQLDEELLLQQKIELEEVKRRKQVELEASKPLPVPELSNQETMDLNLKRVKEAGPKKSKSEMRVH